MIGRPTQLRRHLAGVFLVFACACQGEVIVPDLPDAGDTGSIPDAPVATDVTMGDQGSQIDPLCVGVTCLPNAVCGRGSCWCSPGFMGDPNSGCTAGNPCEGSMCRFGATCDDTGACVCDPGFADDGMGNCLAAEETPVLDRTETEVCTRWAADYAERAGVQWQTQPTEQCASGELDPAYVGDAVRRVSLYRWLVGLGPVTTTTEYAGLAQACATALAAQNVGATNDVTEAFTCYSADAEAGARESSVLLNATSPAAAVDTFIEDAAAASLGNRRWILNPEMGATSFGFRGNYTCMYATDLNGASTQQYLAYPYGTFPLAALRGRWLWASARLVFDQDTTVTITDSAGANVPITGLQVLAGSIQPAALAWDVAGATAGEYTVTIQGIAGAVSEVVYPVTLVTCP